MEKQLIFVSYGGGTNSTAMLAGMYEQGERPDVILFADTGGEKPHTYTHLKAIDEWLSRVGFPTIQVVRYKRETLEEYCLRARTAEHRLRIQNVQSQVQKRAMRPVL